MWTHHKQTNGFKINQNHSGRKVEEDVIYGDDLMNLSFSPNPVKFHESNNENDDSSSKIEYQQMSQELQKYQRQGLDDYTNQYINEFTPQASPQKQQQNSRSSSSQANRNSSQSQKMNLYTKQCSSKYISREISTPTERSLQQNQYIIKSPKDIQETESIIIRSSTKQSHNNNSSFNNTPPKEFRPHSSLSSSNSRKKTQYYSPQKANKLTASTQIPLSSTEIIGSLSSSTILNKSNYLLNRSTNSKLNGSMITSQSSHKQSKSQSKTNVIDDIIKKSAINRLGLTLKPTCSAHKHQQLKYICVDQKCIRSERVLCQECVESFGHEFHDIKTIEEFILLLESSYDAFLRKFFHFKSIKEELEHPSFLGNINKTVNDLKKQICNKLDGIKDNIYVQYQKVLNEMDQTNSDLNSSKRSSAISQFSEIKYSGGYLQNKQRQSHSKERSSSQQGLQQPIKASAETINQEIQRMEEIGNFMESTISKNFFDLTKKDINMSLALTGQQHYIKLEQLHNSLSNKFQSLQNTFTDSINKYTQKLSLLLNDVFENNSEFKIPLPDEYTPEFIKNELMSQQQQLENEMKSKRKQLKLIKQHIIDQQIQTLNNDRTVNRMLPTFPYNTYNTNCYHLIENGILCNTVPIFECCQQAYQCVQCHYKFCKHQPKVTNPSKRYCMQCLSVFKVHFPTDISINCDDCLNNQQIS